MALLHRCLIMHEYWFVLIAFSTANTVAMNFYGKPKHAKYTLRLVRICVYLYVYPLVRTIEAL